MTTTNSKKWDAVGQKFFIGGAMYTLSNWHLPHLLRAGDFLHIDADSLSEIARTEKHRGGTELVHLVDGRQICICGGTDVAVFVRA